MSILIIAHNCQVGHTNKTNLFTSVTRTGAVIMLTRTKQGILQCYIVTILGRSNNGLLNHSFKGNLLIDVHKRLKLAQISS